MAGARVTNEKALGTAVLVSVGAFVLWRVSRARGGMVTLVDLEPGPASELGAEGGGSSNPFTALFAAVGNIFKGPGNAPVLAALPASKQTPVSPLAPPDTMTRTAQPEGFAFLGEGVEYAPNLGDPNMSAWAYLASTPPDLAWQGF